MLNYTGRVISPSGLEALPGTSPQKEELKGVRSDNPRPSSFRALAKRRFRALPPLMSTFSEKHLLDGCVEDKGEMPYVGDVRPLVSPTEGDGYLRPWAITRVGGVVFRSDGEHPPCGELPFSSTFGGGKAPQRWWQPPCHGPGRHCCYPQVVGSL